MQSVQYASNGNGYTASHTTTQDIPEIAIIVDRAFFVIDYHGNRNEMINIYEEHRQAVPSCDFDMDLIDTNTINVELLNECLQHQHMFNHLVAMHGYQKARDMLAGTS